MNKSEIQCTFERLIPDNSIPYWIFWPLISILVFILWEISIKLFNENEYYISLIGYAIIFSYMPIAVIWVYRLFNRIFPGLVEIINMDKSEYGDWLSKRRVDLKH